MTFIKKYCLITIVYFKIQAIRQTNQILKFNIKGSDVNLVSIVKSMTLQGLKGILVNVEVDVSGGMPAWNVVGLPDTAIKESKERIKTAIKNCDVELLSRRYIINLSPADLRKEGAGLDLAIAVATLKSIEKIKEFNSSEILFLGELSLDAKIKKINGILPICLEAVKYGIKKIILPIENAKEASVVEELNIIGVSNLNEVIKYLNGEINIESMQVDINELFKKKFNYELDFSEVKGQESIKRALEIAAAGRTQLFVNWKPWFWKNNDGKKNYNNFARIKF